MADGSEWSRWRGGQELVPGLALPLIHGAAEGGALFLGDLFGSEDTYLDDGLHGPGGGLPALGTEVVRQLDFQTLGVQHPPRHSPSARSIGAASKR
mgnify:CR=1 FL=1